MNHHRNRVSAYVRSPCGDRGVKFAVGSETSASLEGLMAGLRGLVAQYAASWIIVLLIGVLCEKTMMSSGKQPTLWWMAPFYSSGGYCSEAISFALPLETMMPVRISQHGKGLFALCRLLTLA